MAFDFFCNALHSNVEDWIKMARETNAQYQATWDFIKLRFAHFCKHMDFAKVGTVLDNLKMDLAKIEICH